jgi:general secretion pathway protein F
MPAFEYQALDASGRPQRGVLQADTARAARTALRERGLNPLQVATARDSGRTGIGSRSSLGGSQLALLVRQLATLIGSGLPVDESLQAIADGSDGRVRAIVVGLRARVMEGASLANAMGELPEVFPPLFRASVAAGESSGKLDVVLHRLSEYAEARDALRRKVLLALTYPALLVTVALAVVVGLMLWVVPQVVGVFMQHQQVLPLPTRILIGLSAFFERYGAVVVALAVVLPLLALAAMRSASARFAWHRVLLGLPILGRLVRANETARFARTLALLVGSAVPLLESLGIAAQVVENQFLRQVLQRVGVRVREGLPFARVLSETGYFPPVAVRLIASGERSGRLDHMLAEAAHNQERELDTALGVAMAALGPGVILGVGALVLFIVLAILLPIFELNSLIR